MARGKSYINSAKSFEISENGFSGETQWNSFVKQFAISVIMEQEEGKQKMRKKVRKKLMLIKIDDYLLIRLKAL